MSHRSISPELNPLDLSEDLVPSNEPKEAGQTSLGFSGLLDPPLKLHEDLKEGCGGQIWPAGTVLTRFLLRRTDELRGKTIIELGAGGGLVGLALALSLSRSKTSKGPPLLITDLPQLLPLQEQNIALNNLGPSSVLSAAFCWGGSTPDTVPEPYRHPDIILAADCVYFEPAFPLLLESLEELLGKDARPIVGGPVCWFCMKKRRKADMRFIAALKRAFDVAEVEVEKQREDEQGVHLYRVVRRSRQSLTT